MAVQKLTKAPIKAPPKKLSAPPPVQAPPKKLGAPRAADLNQQAAAIVPPTPAKLKGKSHTDMDTGPTFHAPGAFPFDDERPGENEVRIAEHLTSGRRELDRVCQEKGLMWGIVSTSIHYTKPLPHPGTMKVTLLIGSKYEFESGEHHGYPQAVDACLLGLAAELESEG